jgi:hypothetical protein
MAHPEPVSLGMTTNAAKATTNTLAKVKKPLFTTVEQLVANFLSDVARERSKK